MTKSFDDTAKAKLADTVAALLQLQILAAGNASMDDENDQPNRKALGYVYGFVDAALCSVGQDMADVSVGVPVTFQVIRKLWPKRVTDYMEFLAKNIRSDDFMMIGVMHGGQQYVDYMKPGASGAPMGLARFMIASNNPPKLDDDDNAALIALIDSVLDLPILPSTADDLRDYKKQIMSGTIESDDRKYVSKLCERLRRESLKSSDPALAAMDLAAKTGAPTPRIFAIGIYRLDATVAGLFGLVEFSPSEYATMGRTFEGERNYNTPPVEFLGRRWNVSLQTVNGQISKIAPYLLLRDKQEANLVATEVLNYCIEKLGTPTEQRTGSFIWDTTDGNVILQTGETADGLGICLFLTSRSIRNFRRL